MKRRALLSSVLFFLVFSSLPPGGNVKAQRISETATPAPLVETYRSLADAILAHKATEKALVHSILSMTYQHAEMTFDQAMAKIGDGRGARAEIETLADLVSQLGNEGDAQVAAVRKKLLEGGHHHNAAGEQKGIYDPGFVIVTRTAKKTFLQAATAIGRMGGSPDASALKTQWNSVRTAFQEIDAGSQ